MHVITPGDHFSPRTGSAIPTVVAGLAAARAAVGVRDTVVVARGTYPDRYDTADIVEYSPDHRRLPAQRHVDVLLAKLALPRLGAAREWRATLTRQHDWPASFVIGHNAVQLMPLVDHTQHLPVLYAHNDLFRSYSWRELRRSLADVHRIVCVSDFLAGRLAAHLPAVLADRIRIVPNGADIDRFRPGTPPTRAGLSVVFLGRMIEDKGPDVAISALALLDRADIALRLIGSYGFDPAAGLSEYERSLRAAAAPLGTRVQFVPTQPRDAVGELLRSADVLVVPSRWAEPSGLTVLEGMASGVVVIASDVGGIPASLGEAGLLVPPDDPVALADALARVADDTALRARLRAAARHRAEQRDWAWASRTLDQALR